MTISGMACDSKGDLYACAAGVGVIYKWVNGAFTPFAGQYNPYPGGGFQDGVGQSALLKLPSAPAFDAQDNLYFIDRDNHAIRKITPAGIVTTLAGSPVNRTMVDGKGSAAGFEEPSKLLALKDGSLLVVDGTRWRKVMPDGTVSTLAGTAPAVVALAGVDATALYAVVGHGIVQQALDGSSVNVAGNPAVPGQVDGLKDAARFTSPTSLSIASDGKLIVADQGNAMIRRVDPASGQVSTWVASIPQPSGIDGTGAQVRFDNMGASCLDRDGNLYVIETLAKTVRKITPAGRVSTLFTNFPSDGGLAVDADGYFYGVSDRAIIKVSPSGQQKVFAGGSLGYADGVGGSAEFATPMGLAFDAQGNLLVGDSPFVTYLNQPWVIIPVYQYGSTIRKITPTGVVTTIAGTPGRVVQGFPDPDLDFIEPKALACDGSGRVWVRDRSGVRRIDAGGGTPVRIGSPNIGVGGMAYALGSPGDVYVADWNSILKLGANGTQTVVAGATSNGVQLGALPASLGSVSFIVSASPRVLYVGSGNAVLRIQLS